MSLDSSDYEGMWFADPSPTPAEICVREDEQRRVNEFKETLTPTQLRRLELLEEGNSLREVARLENTNLSAIQKTRDQIRKNTMISSVVRVVKMTSFSPYSVGGTEHE